MPPNLGNDSLGRECPHGRAEELLEDPLGVPQGRKYPLHLLFVFNILLRFARNPGIADLSAQA